jgi:GTP-binding protein
VFTKLDLLGEEYVPELRTDAAFGIFSISGAARTGLQPMLEAWWAELSKLRQVRLPAEMEL